jgi:DNA polymerase III delta prime subunit
VNNINSILYMFLLHNNNNNNKMPSHNQTIIQKYKPKQISDFHMDPEFIAILDTLFMMDDLNLLLVGNPNSGKTSFLYTLVRKYYGMQYTDNIPETNVMFINNLREQGINYYRSEMKTFSQSKCSIYDKKKLIVIDDMDSINEQSQQVFRNYLDKYRQNISIISVCTNIQKIIESIQSRMTVLRIRSLSPENIRNTIMHIVDTEKIQIDPLAIEYILKISGNSVRTAMNNIEKAFLIGEHVDLNMCKTLCLNISSQYFEDYFRAFSIAKNADPTHMNIQQPVNILYTIHDFGYSVIDILDYMFAFIKITDMLSESQKYRIIPILCNYITIFNNIHEDVLELALLTADMYPIVCDRTDP